MSSKQFKKFDIVCPGCKGVYHETTEHYDPKVFPKPNMCILKEPYRSYMWEDFGQLGSSTLGDMCCPGCGYPYVAGCGKLIVKPAAPAAGRSDGTDESAPEAQPLFMCPICGDSFEYRVALAGHMKSHKKNHIAAGNDRAEDNEVFADI